LYDKISMFQLPSVTWMIVTIYMVDYFDNFNAEEYDKEYGKDQDFDCRWSFDSQRRIIQHAQ